MRTQNVATNHDVQPVILTIKHESKMQNVTERDHDTIEYSLVLDYVHVMTLSSQTSIVIMTSIEYSQAHLTVHEPRQNVKQRIQMVIPFHQLEGINVILKHEQTSVI